MADPLSIASGVAGLISLGLTLCNGLHTYFSTIKDRDKDIEIVTRDLTLLRFNIEVIESSTLKLVNRRTLACDAVNMGLKNCESQLKNLETFIQKLSSAEGLSGAQVKWRKQKMAVRYPFDQKKLTQLQEQLLKANHTLSTFIQTFNLYLIHDNAVKSAKLTTDSEVNIGIHNSLQIMDKDMRINDTAMIDLLSSISTRLNVIGPTVQRTEMEIATLPIRVRDQTLATNNSRPLLHEAVLNDTETQPISISDQHPCNPPSEGDLQPRYLRNSDAERRLCSNFTITECTCMGPTRRAVSRRTSRIYQFWGCLAISKQGGLQSNHRPGCIFFNSSPRTSWKTSLTYSGLRSVFSQSLTISLTQDYPAGLYSLSFGLQPCNVIKNSAAFLLFDHTNYEMIDEYLKTFGPVEATDKLIQKLKIIYSSGNASPFDVDEDGNNIAHICMQRFFTRLCFVKNFQTYEKAIEAICRLLSYMFDIGVPVTMSNFHGCTVLNYAADHYQNLWMLPKLYELATVRDPAFYSNEFAHKRSDLSFWSFRVENQYDKLNVWCEYPEISEAVGFQPIFLAVMQKDLSKLEDLLKDSNSLKSILHTDLYKRNILHVSSDWAAGLRLLLEYEAVYPLLHATSAFEFNPLDHALLYSKMYCNAPDQWALCHNCSCFTAVKLLLEADCSVTVGRWRPQTLEACTLRARMLFFEHLKNRRERLRRISLAYLPAAVLTRYGITTRSLPDATAMVLWDELQKRANDVAQRAIGLGESLRPHSGEDRSSPVSFFSHPHRIEVAELALSYGFQPKDECGLRPFISRMVFYGNGTLEEVSYAGWLLQRDLEIEFTMGPFQLSAVHSYGKFLGFWIKNFYSKGGVFPTTSLYEFNNLLSMICHSERQSNLPCPCLSGTFNRPLSYLMSGLELPYSFTFAYHTDRNIWGKVRLMALLVDLIGDPTYRLDMTYVAKCAIHILTMKFLGIRHLPGCNFYTGEVTDIPEDPEWQEECAEILHEDRLLLSRLHNLEEDFSREFERQNVSIANFLQGYWLRKIEEVEGELDNAVSDDYKSDLCEIGVVLGKGKDSSFNPSN